MHCGGLDAAQDLLLGPPSKLKKRSSESKLHRGDPHACAYAPRNDAKAHVPEALGLNLISYEAEPHM